MTTSYASSSLPSRCRRAFRRSMDRLIDWHWRIDTLSGTWTFSEKGAKFEDAAEHIPVSYYLLFRLLGRTPFKPDDVFYDIGCGNGRVLCYVARKRVRKVIGIELSNDFADRARTNAQRLRGRVSPMEVRCGDAAEMDFSDGNVFFLFNPFGPKTLQTVLENIRQTLANHSRPLRFMYQNPVHSSIFRSSGYLKYAGKKTGMLSKQYMELWTFDG
jgi:SAM-dependent methyltransferase